MTWYARVYPNGEFGIGYANKKDVGELIDSSSATNSHKEAERKARGQNGISPYGRKMVRNGCYLLEKKYGRECLSFLTLTLPAMTEEENAQVCKEWSEIVRIAMQAIRRLLRHRNLPGHIVGVVEIQPGRFSRDGGMPLHLHCVFKGKENKWKKGWPVKPNEFRECWRRAVVARVPDMKWKVWNAAENVQQVKKSAEGYLGKYLSKGDSDLQAVESAGLSDLLPSAWWVCSIELREAIKVNTLYSSDIADFLLSRWHDQSQWSPFQYKGECVLESEEGSKVVGYYGRLHDKWALRKLLGMNPYGDYEWDADLSYAMHEY